MKARQLLGTILLLLAPISVLSASNAAERGADSLHLSVGVDAVTFFRNNEYHAEYQLGYTLPGWQLAPTVALEHRQVRLVGGGLQPHFTRRTALSTRWVVRPLATLER